MVHDEAIGTLALLLGAGLAVRLAADLLRLPQLVLLLGAGLLLGPDALGWLDVPLESDAAQLLLTLGVSFILFQGGLHLALSVLRGTALGLFLLVVPGVVVTAGVVGVVAAAVFEIPLLHGLLIGAVLAPTDPAILIPLFDRLRLRPRLAQTIVAESALNDPTAAVLALALAGAVAGGGASIGDPALEFVVDVGVSTGLGLLFGLLLSLVVSSGRFGVWRESAGIAVGAVVAASFVSIDFAGGSGYLGAFLAGFILGNMDELKLAMDDRHAAEVRTLVHAVSDIVVLLVFLVLGANLPLGAMGDEWLPALAVVATLILVARPLVVALCLLPDRRARWSRDELLFLAWTRETGVLPAALVGILAALAVPDAELAGVCVAFAVVVTVTVQASTKGLLARRLGLGGEPLP